MREFSAEPLRAYIKNCSNRWFDEAMLIGKKPNLTVYARNYRLINFILELMSKEEIPITTNEFRYPFNHALIIALRENNLIALKILLNSKIKFYRQNQSFSILEYFINNIEFYFLVASEKISKNMVKFFLDKCKKSEDILCRILDIKYDSKEPILISKLRSFKMDKEIFNFCQIEKPRVNLTSSLLIYAAKSMNRYVLRFLIKHSNKILSDQDHCFAILNSAISNNRIDNLIELIDHIDISILENFQSNNQHLINLAIDEGNGDLLQAVFKKGMSMDFQQPKRQQVYTAFFESFTLPEECENSFIENNLPVQIYNYSRSNSISF